ncbi:hypothetical protein BC829DRAFT_386523 [Chytridium lagenaria]|nr:hypothetical protein BC829DRAFT_386523 [Chytridium lagenaria]
MKKSVVIKLPAAHGEELSQPPIDEDEELLDRLLSSGPPKEEAFTSITKPKSNLAKPLPKKEQPKTLHQDLLEMNDSPQVTEVDKMWFESVAGNIVDSCQDLTDDVSREEERLQKIADEDYMRFNSRLITMNHVKERWQREEMLQNNLEAETAEEESKRVEQEAIQEARMEEERKELLEEQLRAPVFPEDGAADKDDLDKPELPVKETTVRPKSRMTSARRKSSKKASVSGATSSGRPASSRAKTPK